MKNNILAICIRHEGNTRVGIHVSDEPQPREEFLEAFLRGSLSIDDEDDDFYLKPMIESIMKDFDQMTSGEHISTYFRYGERIDIDISRKDHGN